MRSGLRCSEPDTNPPPGSTRRTAASTARSSAQRDWHRLRQSGTPQVVTRDAFIARHSDRIMLEYLSTVVARMRRKTAKLRVLDSEAATFARLFLPPTLLNVVVDATNVALGRHDQPLTTAPELVRFIQTTLALQLTCISKSLFFECERQPHMLEEARFDWLRKCVRAWDTEEPGPLAWHDVGDCTSRLDALEQIVALTNTSLLVGTYAGDIIMTIDDDLHR